MRLKEVKRLKKDGFRPKTMVKIGQNSLLGYMTKTKVVDANGNNETKTEKKKPNQAKQWSKRDKQKKERI